MHIKMVSLICAHNITPTAADMESAFAARILAALGLKTDLLQATGE